MDDRFLRIYMNDQLAAGVIWREVALRSKQNNEGSDLGDALARVSAAIAEDVATFEEMMERLDIPRNPVKPRLAIAAERMGRLKLNGSVSSYSPLSRFLELDFLAMGIEGKKLLWETLRDLAGLSVRLPDVDFDALIERAQWQRDELEPFRARAGREVFGGPAVAAA
jgi:hypothetical protein